MNLRRISLSVGAFVMIWSSIAGCGSNSSPSTIDPPQASEQQSEQENSLDQGAAANTQLTGPQDRDSKIALAMTSAERGQLDDAASRLKELLLVDPTDVEVLFHLANVEAARGNLAEAIETLRSIPEDHPEAALPSLGQSADWCLQLERYDDAERRYRSILDRIPDASLAHHQLAQLLNRQGRRHEAAEQVRELCKMDNVRQDELHSLISLRETDRGQTDRGQTDRGQTDRRHPESRRWSPNETTDRGHGTLRVGEGVRMNAIKSQPQCCRINCEHEG